MCGQQIQGHVVLAEGPLEALETSQEAALAMLGSITLCSTPWSPPGSSVHGIL